MVVYGTEKPQAYRPRLVDERLRKKVASNPAARNPKLEFCAVVTAMSPFCRYDAAHDVYVFPIIALRP